MSREDPKIHQIIPALGWYAVFEPDKDNPTPKKLPIACWGLKDCGRPEENFGSQVVPLVCYLGEGHLDELDGTGFDLVYLPNDDGRLAVPAFATAARRRAEAA